MARLPVRGLPANYIHVISCRSMGDVKVLGVEVPAEVVAEAASRECGRGLGRYAFYVRPSGDVIPLEAAREAELGLSRFVDAPTIEARVPRVAGRGPDADASSSTSMAGAPSSGGRAGAGRKARGGSTGLAVWSSARTVGSTCKRGLRGDA
jgi:hypothetical protein